MTRPAAAWTILASLAMTLHGAMRPAVAQTPRVGAFDGSWAVTLACAIAPDDARGYTYQFPAQVIGGKLHGENGIKGESGWLVLDGQIRPDGTATLLAAGLTGNPAYSVGRVPHLTPYSYHVDARFDARHGTGRRVELRSCQLDFEK